MSIKMVSKNIVIFFTNIIYYDFRNRSIQKIIHVCNYAWQLNEVGISKVYQYAKATLPGHAAIIY